MSLFVSFWKNWQLFRPWLPRISATIANNDVRINQNAAAIAHVSAIANRIDAILIQDELAKEFARVRFIITDLNGEYDLEKNLCSCGKAFVATKLQRSTMNKNYFSHYFLDDDTPNVKAAKTKYALERLEGLDETIVSMFAEKYGPEVLPSVLEFLRRLNLYKVEMDDSIRKDGDDWWSGLDG